MERDKRKKKLDVNSGWKTYLNEVKEKLMQEKPELTKREFYSLASKMWEEEPTTVKSAYARKEKRHNKRKKEYSDSDSDTVFDNEKLKQHISAHSVFVNEKQTELKETHAELTLLERAKIIEKMWKNLSHAEKQIYENKAKCINRRIDKDSTDSDEEKYTITKREKEKEKINFDEYKDDDLNDQFDVFE